MSRAFAYSLLKVDSGMTFLLEISAEEDLSLSGNIRIARVGARWYYIVIYRSSGDSLTRIRASQR